MYLFRDQLSDNLLLKQHFIELDMSHLISYNTDLANRLIAQPAEMLPLFETAVREAAKRILSPNPSLAVDVPDCQVMLKSDANVVQIRDLNVGLI